MAGLRRTYLKIRSWVDRGVGDTSGHLKLVMLGPVIIPIAIFGPLVGGSTPSERTARLAPILVWAAIWIMFSIWRGLRMLKAQSAKNARYHDRIGKYELPPEYAGGESALKVKRRRKSA